VWIFDLRRRRRQSQIPIPIMAMKAGIPTPRPTPNAILFVVGLSFEAESGEPWEYTH
jgi:hypothetical protein